MRRPRFRMTLGAMMLALLAVGVPLGLAARRAHIQAGAVAAIRRAGGSVVYSYQWKPNRWPDPSGRPGWIARTLEPWLGPDYWYAVREVSLSGDRPDDALMAEVGRLEGLESLGLSGAKNVTDAGVAHLAGLDHMVKLSFYGTRATAACLESLAGMSRLEELLCPADPARTATDADLAHLAGLTRMRRLNFMSADDGLTDAGLAHLAGMKDLELLHIRSRRITSAGLAALQGMNRLRLLYLDGCRLSDLGPLRHLAGLEQLGVAGNPIDEAWPPSPTSGGWITLTWRTPE